MPINEARPPAGPGPSDVKRVSVPSRLSFSAESLATVREVVGNLLPSRHNGDHNGNGNGSASEHQRNPAGVA
jgi:hypothetical protein